MAARWASIAGLYVSEDNGATWTRPAGLMCSTTLPGPSPTVIVATEAGLVCGSDNAYRQGLLGVVRRDDPADEELAQTGSGTRARWAALIAQRVDTASLYIRRIVYVSLAYISTNASLNGTGATADKIIAMPGGFSPERNFIADFVISDKLDETGSLVNPPSCAVRREPRGTCPRCRTPVWRSHPHQPPRDPDHPGPLLEEHHDPARDRLRHPHRRRGHRPQVECVHRGAAPPPCRARP